MDVQRIVAAVGSAATTFLVVGAVVIEAVMAAVGGDVGPGMVGVAAGALAAIAAVLAVRWRWASVSPPTRWAVLGYGAFGLTLLFLALLSYVDVPGVDEHLDLARNLVVAAFVAGAVAIAGRRAERRAPPG